MAASSRGAPLVRTFVGLASEWEDDPARRSEYEAEIVAVAKALVESGGLSSDNSRTVRLDRCAPVDEIDR
jgi:hypothetical protein